VKQQIRVVIASGLFALAFAPAAAQQGDDGFRYGVSVAGAVVGSPLGQVAQSYGFIAIPGFELDARLRARAYDHSEWSVGVTGDRYVLDMDLQPFGRWQFDYSSIAAVAGRSWLPPRDGAPIRYGIDLGVRYFTVNSTRPEAQTSQPHANSVTGTAALIAVSYAVEVATPRFTYSPRLRLETNYPDFGGGDGHTDLHRTSALGFRASAGIAVKTR
jgi:hypothetical protein